MSVSTISALYWVQRFKCFFPTKLFLFDVAFKQVSWLFLLRFGCMVIWLSSKVITALIQVNVTIVRH